MVWVVRLRLVYDIFALGGLVSWMVAFLKWIDRYLCVYGMGGDRQNRIRIGQWLGRWL